MKSPTPFYESYALFVILGHYGSGKTNLALNLAKKLKELGREPLVIDLDIVNPYFRSTDYLELMEDQGVRVVGPALGSLSLDIPSLAPGIDAMIERATLQEPVIIDVGGDPDGARALVRYTPAINCAQRTLVLLVVNLRRPETQSLEGNLKMIAEILETTSLPIDALIGNTHLAEFTTQETVEQSLPLLKELSERSNLQIVALTMPQGVYETIEDKTSYLSVERLVKTNWQ